MNSKNCLNCEAELHGKFCCNCGQKAETRRITFGTFIAHDLLHGLFHLDKGILYTLRALVLSPGYAVKSFLLGKRVQHYNIFALFIIVIAIKTFLDGQSENDLFFDSYDNNVSDEKANKILDNYYKVFYLLCIPVLSFFSFIFFRKLKYNYTEHIVLNCFLMTGGFIYSLVLSLVSLIINSPYPSLFGFTAMLAYLLVGFYQATKLEYKFFGYLWRVVLVLVLYAIIIFTGLMEFVHYFYGEQFVGHIGFKRN